jgi:hypothetical protein
MIRLAPTPPSTGDRGGPEKHAYPDAQIADRLCADCRAEGHELTQEQFCSGSSASRHSGGYSDRLS